MNYVTSFRDPFRSTFEDVVEADPWVNSVVNPWAVPSTPTARARINPSAKMIHMDAFESDKEFRVIIECPGVPTEKFDVSIDAHLLTVRCSKPAPDYSNTFNMVRNEIVYGNETRSVRIPTNCNQEPSLCHYKDGCLCIHFPKMEHYEGKKLHIQSA